MGGLLVKPLAARAKGPEFDSPIVQHVQRLISPSFTYSAVVSLILSWSWTQQPGLISFQCLWIQLCNNFGQKLCVYNLP